MKKLLFCLLLLVATGLNAQTVKKEVPMTVKYYDKINTIKKNYLFDFIGKPEKMTEVYDCDGKVASVQVETSDYFIEFKNNFDVFISYPQRSAYYYCTVVDTDLMGHGFIVDKTLHRILTCYFQDEKLLKETVIKNRS